jgi:hypothetical protein
LGLGCDILIAFGNRELELLSSVFKVGVDFIASN